MNKIFILHFGDIPISPGVVVPTAGIVAISATCQTFPLLDRLDNN